MKKSLLFLPSISQAANLLCTDSKGGVNHFESSNDGTVL
jgi:hypothetical protein